MAIIKCKMCGGDIDISSDKTFGTCEYCGSVMTLPKVDDEQRAAAFNRGNHFRRIGEFDKALSVYERIVQEDENDAEAHWCCALCRFGIEYVEDPATYEWLPTCHRASFDSFLEDVDYLAAVEHSDGVTRRQYQKDAAKIAEVQRGILATSQSEEPFDVFICYKESDDVGNRTKDSTLAQDIYYQLTEQGRRVFFARITLEDKVGAQYEPYIFAALHSAKVMIVVGTKPEYFNAVWVKNEWSRFLSLMRKDRTKLLLPCYRDMDPYDLPEQLSVLQSYDMGKIGFIQDLIRGVNKVLDGGKKPESGKLDAEAERQRNLKEKQEKERKVKNQRIAIFSAVAAVVVIAALLVTQVIIPANNYNKALALMENGEYTEAIAAFEALGDYKDAAARKEQAELEAAYQEAAAQMEKGEYAGAAAAFAALGDYKDSAANKKYASYLEATDLMEKGEYAEAIAAFEALGDYKDSAANKKYASYLEATDLMEKGEYAEAIAAFAALKDYKDAAAKEAECIMGVNYQKVAALEQNGEYGKAAIAFDKLGDYRDAKERSLALWEQVAQRDTVSAGSYHTVGLKSDGTVVAVGNNGYGQCDVFDWTDIVAVSAGAYHTVALKSDGTVVAVGNNTDWREDYCGQCEVSDWTDIVAVSAGALHTVGLKSDGTVVAVGDNEYGQCDVSDWTDIVAVSTGDSHTVGLKSDGTVVAVGWNEYGPCDVSGWKDIVAVSAGSHHTMGLKSDGTVVAAGGNTDGFVIYCGQCEVSDWTDIVAVSAGALHTVGLKSDGKVVAVGANYDGQCDVSAWRDIVAVSAGVGHTVGLKWDGTVVAVGNNIYEYGEHCGQCDVSGWRNIKLPQKSGE